MRATMGRVGEIMVRRNSQRVMLIDEPWVRVDLREVFTNPEMLNDGFDEEHVGVAHYPKLTPGNRTVNIGLETVGFV